MTVILASQSPRRRQLLGQMGFTDFKICPARGEEVAAPGLTPAQLVEALSSQKAAEVAAAAEADALIIAADTVVAVDDRVLGKPHSEEEAAEMLLSLSGREHTVYTGVTLRRGSQIVTRHEATQVRFRSLTKEEIDAYVATGEPMDKAGAYAIQGGCMPYIREIQGEYTTIVGLPVGRLWHELKKFG